MSDRTDRIQHMIRSVGSVALEVASGGDFKAKLPQKEPEYITTWYVRPQIARKWLRDMGYTYQPFAARKFLDGYGRDDGSYAKVDPEDQSKQYHVHIYARDSGVEVYSHYEYRVIHPWKHYNSAVYKMGEICDKMEERA